MNIFDCFPSKYLKAADFQGQDVTLMIVAVRMEPIGDDEEKPIVRFEEAKRGLLLNRTNARTIAELHGQDTDAWRGKRITLFPTTTEFRGSVVECIRVRPAAVAVEAVIEQPVIESPVTESPVTESPAEREPVFAGGRIYFSNQEGVTTVIKPSRSYTRVATNTLDDGLMASPAIAGQALYLRTASHLYRIEEGY